MRQQVGKKKNCRIRLSIKRNAPSKHLLRFNYITACTLQTVSHVIINLIESVNIWKHAITKNSVCYSNKTRRA